MSIEDAAFVWRMPAFNKDKLHLNDSRSMFLHTPEGVHASAEVKQCNCGKTATRRATTGFVDHGWVALPRNATVAQ